MVINGDMIKAVEITGKDIMHCDSFFQNTFFRVPYTIHLRKYVYGFVVLCFCYGYTIAHGWYIGIWECSILLLSKNIATYNTDGTSYPNQSNAECKLTTTSP